MLRFKIREYLSENGQSPFDNWLIGLRDLRARARDTKAGCSNRQGLLGKLQEARKWQLVEITKTV